MSSAMEVALHLNTALAVWQSRLNSRSLACLLPLETGCISVPGLTILTTPTSCTRR